MKNNVNYYPKILFQFDTLFALNHVNPTSLWNFKHTLFNKTDNLYQLNKKSNFSSFFINYNIDTPVIFKKSLL